MASEEQKKQNMLRMSNMIIMGLAKALWDLFGESAFAVMNDVGKNILAVMEQEFGLEVAGEDPNDVLTEIGRIFADEIGYIDSFKVEGEGNEISLIVDKYKGWNLNQEIMKTGVDIPFTCPIMNTAHAALSRMGKRVRRKVEARPDVKGYRITLTFVD